MSAGSITVVALAAAASLVDDGARLGVFASGGAALHRSGDGLEAGGGTGWAGVLVSGVVEGLEVGGELAVGTLSTAVDAGVDWSISLLAGGVVELSERWRYHPRLAVGLGAMSRRRRSFSSLGPPPPTEQTEALFSRVEALGWSWQIEQLHLRVSLPTVTLAVALNSNRRTDFDLGVGLLLGAELAP